MVVLFPACVLWVLSGLAFDLDPIALVNFYRTAASQYPVTSANAYNIWGAVGFWRPDSGSYGFDSLTAMRIGVLLFVAGVGFVIWRTHRAIERGASEAITLMLAAATVSLLAFAALTRMHERYLLTSLALLAPLAFIRPLRLVYAALSALFVLNLWNIYGWVAGGEWRSQPVFDWLFGTGSTDSAQRKLWSLMVTLVVAVVVVLGPRLIGRASPSTTNSDTAAR